jgi:hypothetical protein
VRAARLAPAAGRAASCVAKVLAALDSKAGANETSEYPPLAAEGDMPLADPQADLVALPPDASESGKALQKDPAEVPREALHAAGPGAWQPVAAGDDGNRNRNHRPARCRL